ncbi:TPA: hypothetical protein H2W70_004162 [Salmonella enterica]|nr:hypothetical protein [Salmonella enterica]EBB7908425.1 hypothetical protein [Salmonella enterica]EBK3282629.1 hypothetical protein [Salmonella enterica]HAF2404098.1 hypothetical protein [Salmonella enterica]HAK8195263.1 hypothetical protein [Salmonella enterica]
MNNEELQAQINLLRNAETQAVQTMLLTALQHGFQLEELIKLTEKYKTNAALMECRNGDCIVNYATPNGYFTRNFGVNYQQANDFVEEFDTWWYQ